MDRPDSCLGIEMAEKLDWNSRLGHEIFSIESFRLVSVSPSLVSTFEGKTIFLTYFVTLESLIIVADSNKSDGIQWRG